VQHCHASFDDQLVRLYTRKVYLEYRHVFDKSTTFRMDPNPGVPNGFLVKHQRGGGGFCWSDHAFHVHADVVEGEYRASVGNESILVRFAGLQQYISYTA
jgi:hypothetical protein